MKPLALLATLMQENAAISSCVAFLSGHPNQTRLVSETGLVSFLRCNTRKEGKKNLGRDLRENLEIYSVTAIWAGGRHMGFD